MVTLDKVQPENEAVILPDFAAFVEGKEVWVTAVLERTAIIQPEPGMPKQLVRRSDCLVDPRDLRFNALAARNAAKRGREAARRNRMQQETAA
jgi:hypothetical protein